MQKKNMSLISFILLSVYVVLSFIPIIFTEEFWVEDYLFGTRGFKRNDNLMETVNMYSMFNHDNFFLLLRNIFAYIGLILSLTGIVGLILQYADKNIKAVKYMTFAPIGEVIILFILLITGQSRIFLDVDNVDCYFAYKPAWGFIVEAGLIIAVSVMSVLIGLGKVKNTEVNQKTKANESSSADELKKYKDLLDNGVISQEEFDAKKKQLLGL